MAAPYHDLYENHFAHIRCSRPTFLGFLNYAVTAAADSPVATLTTWRMLYAALASANVGRPSPLPLLPDLNTALAAQAAAAPAATAVLVQCLPYATLRPDALTAGPLTRGTGMPLTALS